MEQLELIKQETDELINDVRHFDSDFVERMRAYEYADRELLDLIGSVMRDRRSVPSQIEKDCRRMLDEIRWKKAAAIAQKFSLAAPKSPKEVELAARQERAAAEEARKPQDADSSNG